MGSFGGLFSGGDKNDQSQRFTDDRVSATDGAVVQRGTGHAAAGSVYAPGGALTQTDSSTTVYNDADLMGLALSGNLALATAGNTTARDLAAQGIEGNATLARLAIKRNAALAQSMMDATKTRDKTLADVLAANERLAVNQQTGGEAGRNEALLYVTLAALALVGWLFWRR